MRILAISGSIRRASTNTALLRALARAAPVGITVEVSEAPRDLPIFSQDLEGPPAPAIVEAFAAAVGAADGIVIACPEYVHALPGGFKNAIDWLVSRDEIIGKPIVLIHASHRGDDALTQLRLVLGTVSQRFAPDIFERFSLTSLTPAQIEAFFEEAENAARLQMFLQTVTAHIRAA